MLDQALGDSDTTATLLPLLLLPTLPLLLPLLPPTAYYY